MTEWYFLDADSTHRGQLVVRSSKVHGYGLYTLEPINKDAAVGVWTGTIFAEDEWERDRYGLELRYDRRNVVVMTPVSQGTVDYNRHPFAALNEPPIQRTSNVYIRIEEHDHDGIAHLMAVFYAAVDIAAGQELWWHYGAKYTRDYEVGAACAPTSDPPLSHSRFERVRLKRSDGLYAPDTTSESSSDESYA